MAHPRPDYFYRVYPLEDRSIAEKFFRPHQSTLLHRLIDIECEVAFRAGFDNHGPKALHDYLLYYLNPRPEEETLKETLVSWCERYRSVSWGEPYTYLQDELLTSILPLDDLTDLMFYNLFADRLFLFKLNQALSMMVRFLKYSGFPDHLEQDGKIKRLDYVPKWLKRGIMKRDRGHCVYCGKDLTGTREIEVEHFDHMIHDSAC